MRIPKKILALIQDDMRDLAEKYGDDRRTRIAAEATESLSEADLVQDEAVLISLTERGYVKRVAASAFRSQSRGGRGVMGHTTKDEDEVVALIPARSLDTMLFFSDRGKVYSEKVYQIPDADRAAKGIPLVNVLALDANERVTAAIAVSDFSAHGFCMLATITRQSQAGGDGGVRIGPTFWVDRHYPGGWRQAWLGAPDQRQGRSDLRDREWTGPALQRKQGPRHGTAGSGCAGNSAPEW